jgi:hypothetical protein
MTSRQIRPSQSLDKRIFELLDDTWRTVGDIRRLLGGGSALDVAQALDRLWEVERIEKHAVPAIDSVGRRGGGGELHFLKFRRKQEGDRTLDSTAP